MKLQRISNITRQQNFGDILVLERGNDATWDNIAQWTNDISPRRDSFVTDKGGILLSTGDERDLLELKIKFIADLREKKLIREADLEEERLHALIRTYGEIARTGRAFVINTLNDLVKISIPGFDDLIKLVKN